MAPPCEVGHDEAIGDFTAGYLRTCSMAYAIPPVD